MGSLGGKTKTLDTTSPEVQELRNQFVNYISGRSTGVPGISSPEFDEWLRTQYPRGTARGAENTPGNRQMFYDKYKAFYKQHQPTTTTSGASSFFDQIFKPSAVDRPPEVGIDSRGWIDPSAIPRARTGFEAPQIEAFGRGQIRDVAGVPDVTAGTTRSVDQLGGVKSDFFNNMMQQLAPAFDQRRAEGLAAAREASGNLTGSGRSNFLGAAVNRSLGEEQERLAGYAAQGVGMETAREQEAVRQALQAATANQGMRFQTGAANQRADTDFLSALLERGKANQGASLQAAELGQRGEFANMDSVLKTLMSNQGVAQLLAKLTQDRGMGIYGTESDMKSRQSQLFLQAIMALLSKGEVQPYTQGGVGSLLGPVLELGGKVAGGKG